MSHIPQLLHDLYPAEAGLLRRLKAEDARFQHLAGRLEEMDEAVHAMDSGADPASDERAEQASRERLHILDEIAALVAAARKAA
jgi:uncharacterized protein YdcH (DUF465 family)